MICSTFENKIEAATGSCEFNRVFVSKPYNASYIYKGPSFSSIVPLKLNDFDDADLHRQFINIHCLESIFHDLYVHCTIKSSFRKKSGQGKKMSL